MPPRPQRNVTRTATPAPPTSEPAKDDLMAHALATLPPAVDSDALVPVTEVDDVFSAYTADRDELLSTPFAANRAMAQQATTFTIIRTGRRELPKMDNPGVMVEKIVYLVTLQAAYTSTDDSNGQVTEHGVGDQELIALDINAVREADEERINSFLETYGRIPNCALQQYPARKKGHSPSHGIVHVSVWKPLAEMR